MNKKWKIAGVSVAVLIAGAILAGIVLLPMMGPYLCPGCYGFDEIARRVYEGDKADDKDSAALLDELAKAQSYLAAIYPEPMAPMPAIFSCMTPGCYAALGGKKEKAATFHTWAIRVSPQGRNANVLAHELAHVELHHRVGIAAMSSSAVPAWFDEGLAVVVSRDPRYLTIGPSGELSCKGRQGANLPVQQSNWNREAAANADDLYSASACRVIDWLGAHTNPDAVGELAAALRDGQPFVE